MMAASIAVIADREVAAVPTLSELVEATGEEITFSSSVVVFEVVPVFWTV